MRSISLLALLLVASCAAGDPCAELAECGDHAVAACEGANDPATVAEQVSASCGSGDGADKAGSQWQTRTAQAGGVQLIEAVPSGRTFEDALPMVVWIHGRGDRPPTPRGPFYVARPMRLILPQAPMPLGSGFAWLPVSPTENKTDILSAGLIERSGEMAAMLAELIATRKPIGLPVVAGFSEGGMLTFALAVRHPEVVGAAFPNAGWLPPPLWPEALPAARMPAIRGTHGAADEIIPIEPTREAVAHLQGLGMTVEMVEFAGVKHEMTAEMHRQLATWMGEVVP